MADMWVLEAHGEIRGGSSPSMPTNLKVTLKSYLVVWSLSVIDLSGVVTHTQILMEVVRQVEETVLKTAGAINPRRFDSYCFRQFYGKMAEWSNAELC